MTQMLRDVKGRGEDERLSKVGERREEGVRERLDRKEDQERGLPTEQSEVAWE